MAGKNSDHNYLFFWKKWKKWKKWKVLRIASFGEKIDQMIFFVEKNEKFLKFSDLARKLIRKTFWQFSPPPPRHLRKFSYFTLQLDTVQSYFHLQGNSLIVLIFTGRKQIYVCFHLHTENQLYTLPGSALKVCVVVGGWVVVLKVKLVISFGFGQAEQYKLVYILLHCYVVLTIRPLAQSVWLGKHFPQIIYSPVHYTPPPTPFFS
jgi:hypothetical protein